VPLFVTSCKYTQNARYTQVQEDHTVATRHVAIAPYPVAITRCKIAVIKYQIHRLTSSEF